MNKVKKWTLVYASLVGLWGCGSDTPEYTYTNASHAQRCDTQLENAKVQHSNAPDDAANQEYIINQAIQQQCPNVTAYLIDSGVQFDHFKTISNDKLPLDIAKDIGANQIVKQLVSINAPAFSEMPTCDMVLFWQKNDYPINSEEIDVAIKSDCADFYGLQPRSLNELKKDIELASQSKSSKVLSTSIQKIKELVVDERQRYNHLKRVISNNQVDVAIKLIEQNYGVEDKRFHRDLVKIALRGERESIAVALLKSGVDFSTQIKLLAKNVSDAPQSELSKWLTNNEAYSEKISVFNKKEQDKLLKVKSQRLASLRNGLLKYITEGKLDLIKEYVKLGGRFDDYNLSSESVALAIIFGKNEVFDYLIEQDVKVDVLGYSLSSSYFQTTFKRKSNNFSGHPITLINLAVLVKNQYALNQLLKMDSAVKLINVMALAKSKSGSALELARKTNISAVINEVNKHTNVSLDGSDWAELTQAIKNTDIAGVISFLEKGGSPNQPIGEGYNGKGVEFIPDRLTAKEIAQTPMRVSILSSKTPFISPYEKESETYQIIDGLLQRGFTGRFLNHQYVCNLFQNYHVSPSLFSKYFNSTPVKTCENKPVLKFLVEKFIANHVVMESAKISLDKMERNLKGGNNERWLKQSKFDKQHIGAIAKWLESSKAVIEDISSRPEFEGGDLDALLTYSVLTNQPVGELINRGANVMAGAACPGYKCSSKMPVYHLALMYGQSENVGEFIKGGADSDFVTPKVELSLYHKISPMPFMSDTELARLVSPSVSMNATLAALLSGNERLVNKVGGKVRRPEVFIPTAIEFNHSLLLENLLDRVSDLDVGIRCDDLNCRVSKLYKGKAVNDSYLTYALKKKASVDVIKLLVSKGAPIDRANASDMKPIDLAQNSPELYGDVFELLSSN